MLADKEPSVPFYTKAFTKADIHANPSAIPVTVDWVKHITFRQQGVVRSHWVPRYGLFTTPLDFYNWYNALQTRGQDACNGVCEMIPSSVPCRMYADFDRKGCLSEVFRCVAHCRLR